MAVSRKTERNDMLEFIWEEFVNQLKAKGYDVKKGVIQDATFITSDPGHTKSDVPRGKEAKTRRSKDGAWSSLDD
jgi:IS5 family transposase